VICRKGDCSLSTSGLESHGNFECIVDNPLEAGKSTNHENSCSKTFPESVESNIGIDFASALTSLVHDRNHGIGWVRNDGAEHTSSVTGGESDHHLSSLAIGVLWSGENVSVESRDDFLESDELDNCVWNLSHPEWFDTSVEAIHTLILVDSLECCNTTLGECSWFRCLHSNFNGLPWAEEDISDELSASR